MPRATRMDSQCPPLSPAAPTGAASCAEAAPLKAGHDAEKGREAYLALASRLHRRKPRSGAGLRYVFSNEGARSGLSSPIRKCRNAASGKRGANGSKQKARIASGSPAPSRPA